MTHGGLGGEERGSAAPGAAGREVGRCAHKTRFVERHLAGVRETTSRLFAAAIASAIAVSASGPAPAHAQPSGGAAREASASNGRTRLTPLSGIGEHTLDAFVGWNTLFHVAAVGSTYALVESGADYETTRFFRDHPSFGEPGIGGQILGYAAPIGAIAGLYVAGRAAHDSETLVASYAVLQSAALTLATVTTLKLVTGRAPPDEVDLASGRDVGHSFRFGFGRGGVIDGWPSGHTAAVTAVATTLATYYRSTALAIVGGIAVAFTGYSMVAYDGGTVHWLSDVVAGFLIAYPIGTTVGRGYREKRLGEQRDAQRDAGRWTIAPMLGQGRLGVSVGATL